MDYFDPRFFDDKDYKEDPEELHAPYDPMFETKEEALENDHRDGD